MSNPSLVRETNRNCKSLVYGGERVTQIYYPEKQLYGGYVKTPSKISGRALIVQNAIVAGNAVVTDEAIVHGDAVITGDVVVTGNADIADVTLKGTFTVGGNAKIRSNDDYIVVGPIGSRGAYTVFHKLMSPGMLGVSCTCFFGTIDEFKRAVSRKHGASTRAYREYMAAIEFAVKAIRV